MYDGFTRTQGRRAAAQTKQNNYFVDAPEREAAGLGKLAALAADYFIALSPTQQNDRCFVALGRSWGSGGGIPGLLRSRKKAGNTPPFSIIE